jgi:hypothetical protein
MVNIAEIVSKGATIGEVKNVSQIYPNEVDSQGKTGT